MKKRSVKATKQPTARQLQDKELARNGYTRKSGAGYEQAKELNRR